MYGDWYYSSLRQTCVKQRVKGHSTELGKVSSFNGGRGLTNSQGPGFFSSSNSNSSNIYSPGSNQPRFYQSWATVTFGEKSVDTFMNPRQSLCGRCGSSLQVPKSSKIQKKPRAYPGSPHGNGMGPCSGPTVRQIQLPVAAASRPSAICFLLFFEPTKMP